MNAQGQRPKRAVSHIRIPLGEPMRDAGPVITWDSKTVVNGHILLAGGSGSGKTHQLRRIIRDLVNGGARRVLLIDVHGDIFPDVPTNTVKFSESTEFGLNPLAVSSDPDMGGPRKRINSFVSMLNRTGVKLGPKQEATIRNLLLDLYATNGFVPEDPKTWDITYDNRPNGRWARKQPGITDLRRFTENKLRMMRFGGSAASVSALEKLTREYQKLNRGGIKVMKGEAEDESLTKLKQACKDLFAEAIDGFESGREINELLRYDSADTVASLASRIANLEGAGIFRGKPPPFPMDTPVWRYDIKALSRTEQQMFVDCLLSEVFLSAKQRGEAEGPDTFIFIDEASIFASEDPDHILNILFREVRKFGIGIILANQHLMDFSEDILISAGSKLVLGVTSEFQEGMRRRLGLDMMDQAGGRRVNPLSLIRPQQTAFAQVKTVGAPSNRMTEIRIVG